tara:strand:+ start:1878 stop:2153 length:276 start_codon:yes stop_codon:yes gene_type:complete
MSKLIDEKLVHEHSSSASTEMSESPLKDETRSRLSSIDSDDSDFYSDAGMWDSEQTSLLPTPSKIQYFQFFQIVFFFEIVENQLFVFVFQV